jgi:uroporphyrinogen III methyltransferase/synthase
MLKGRTVVLTRPRAASKPLAARLRARGARVIFAPLIRTLPPRSWRGLDDALKNMARFDAVVFASANAVSFFFARMKKTLKKRSPAPRIVAAVGAATAKAAAAHGWRCSVVPEDSRAAGLARVLQIKRGARVLLPRAERGLNVLPDSLRAGGARVTLAAAYRTIPDSAGLKTLRRALASGADAVCFASGSAVSALGGRSLRPAVAVAIGPATAAALRARGIVPAAIAKKPDPEAFAQAVERALTRPR